MRDLATNIVPVNGLTSATISTETTTTGATITRSDEESLTFIVKVESYTDGNFTLKLQESADSGSTWTDVDSDNVIGTATALTATGTDYLGYNGYEDTVRMAVVSVNETAAVNSVLSGMVIKGDKRHNQVS